MKWSDVSGVIGQVAPILGTALGGPAGGAIGALVSAALGTTNSPDAVAQAIKADPANAVKLVELQTAHQEMLITTIAQYATVEITEGAANVRAETTSESWITKNWRPMMMLMFGGIIFNNYIFAPYMQAIFNTSVSLPTPPDLWELIKIGLGGYVVGRSGEKIMAMYTGLKGN